MKRKLSSTQQHPDILLDVCDGKVLSYTTDHEEIHERYGGYGKFSSPSGLLMDGEIYAARVIFLGTYNIDDPESHIAHGDEHMGVHVYAPINNQGAVVKFGHPVIVTNRKDKIIMCDLVSIREAISRFPCIEAPENRFTYYTANGEPVTIKYYGDTGTGFILPSEILSVFDHARKHADRVVCEGNEIEDGLFHYRGKFYHINQNGTIEAIFGSAEVALAALGIDEVPA